MNADLWEPLAEVYVSSMEDQQQVKIFCLCSRVFIKNFYNNDGNQGNEEAPTSELEDVCNEMEPKKFWKVAPVPDEDANSCYYSQTDNYCSSTDEGFIHPPVGLHSSDSGADISEQVETEMERNHSLPDVLIVTGVINRSWENFWAENGETLIWASWIEKYSDYIDPQFLQQHMLDNEVAAVTAAAAVAPPPSQTTSITIQAATPNPQDGWNPLSPNSEGTYQRTEMENLLSPRCDSVTSSIPLTIGTTDSMTNVTHMTMDEQYEDFCSSRVTSESSSMSSSVSPESEQQGDSAEGTLNDESGDQYWQVLWQEHFQEQYAIHYKKYVDTQEEACCSLKSESGFSRFKKHHSRNRMFQRKRGGNRFELSGLIADMCIEGGEGEKKAGDAPEPSYDSSSFECPELAAYGLPTSFGAQKSRRGGGGGGGGDDPDDRPRNLKRAHENDDPEDPVKSAFELMGYAYSPDEKVSGEVTYKKKHIRLHNRMLKMKNQRTRHIYFDDDGNEAEAEPEAALIHSSSDDDSHAAAPPQRVPIATTFDSCENPSSLDEPETTVQTADPAAGDIAEATPKREKKKKRKPKLATILPPEIVADKSLLKYWYKRFSLFSKFDQGIKLDKESWFSVTPEKVAGYIAERMRCDIIIDAFCGCGGNTIQFAQICKKVIAIDIDPKKIEMARHNATVYGVLDNIEFIVGDFLQLAEGLKGDNIFLAPPWGGPSYMKQDVYDVEKSLQPVPATELMGKARKISENIAMFLPRNSNTQQLALLAGYGNSVEIEQNFLDRKLIALTAFYGNLINQQQ